MHISHKELERLIKYTEGLGLTVKIVNKIHPFDAACLTYSNPPEITIYKYEGINITDVIVSLLHELGHYREWEDAGKRELSQIFGIEDMSTLNKTEREVVKKSEYKAAYYMPIIAKKLDLKFPAMWKIRAEAAYDKWVARSYYRNGTYPDDRQKAVKRKKLRDLYKSLDKKKK